MKTLLRLEEFAQFLLCLFVLVVNGMPWWVYVLLLVGPDVSMLGYLVNPRFGANCYNLFHHKGTAILVVLSGAVLGVASVHASVEKETALAFAMAATVLYGHASMDRIFGYGLKFGDNFHHTHLSLIHI